MEDHTQLFINWAFAACGALAGWVMKFLYDGLRDLQAADTALVNKVQGIELLVAGQYVKRTELEALSEALFAKLDRIESKLDRKVDK